MLFTSRFLTSALVCCLTVAVVAALLLVPTASAQENEPLRVAVVGMVHGHVGGYLNQHRERDDVQIVGIAEPDRDLAARYAEQYDLDDALLYTDTEAMLDEVQPEAVLAFTNTFDHRQVVEAAAARGVHVMMEKPLAVSMEHARAMQRAARETGIHVLVNYETTWYPSNWQAHALSREEGHLGPLRKIVVRDGHEGPKEIGVGPAFLEWLTDPKLNGAGALMDFGCYGANLMTWLMDGRRPTSVTAVTQQLKSDPVYARVDDEATILVTYPEAQGIIQASWNWPYSRKDMSVYGERGYVHADDPENMRVRIGGEGERAVTADAPPSPYSDPLTYLTAVVREEVEPTGLSSLANNMVVTEILDAARRSAETGQTVYLADE